MNTPSIEQPSQRKLARRHALCVLVIFGLTFAVHGWSLGDGLFLDDHLHQLKLADRQCRINALSSRVQDTIIMLVTCLYADQLGDEATVAAADVLCRDLKRQLKGGHATDADFKASAKLAKLVVDGKFRQLDDVPATPVMRTYQS